MFLELEQRQTLSYSDAYSDIPGKQTILGILERFQGTPISEALTDYPEGATIPAALLNTLVQRQLHSSLKQVEVQTDPPLVFRRAMAMEIYPPVLCTPKTFDEFDEDEDITEETLRLAQPIRETIMQLVPAVQDDADSLVVGFTPVVKTDRQLILYEYRFRQMFVNPAESSHVHEVEEEQYTVFTRNERDEWQQQGVLPFLTLSEYRDRPRVLFDEGMNPLSDRALELQQAKARVVAESGLTYRELSQGDPQEGEYYRLFQEFDQELDAVEEAIQQYDIIPLRKVTAVVDAPHESAIFNEGVNKPDEVDVLEGVESRGIFAALPDAFDFPPPTHHYSEIEYYYRLLRKKNEERERNE